jgi:hypothetical protein
MLWRRQMRQQNKAAQNIPADVLPVCHRDRLLELAADAERQLLEPQSIFNQQATRGAKGGPREGAGRPRGSRGRRTKESIAKAEALGPTPLEVLLESMHAARAEGERAEAQVIGKHFADEVSFVRYDLQLLLALRIRAGTI